MDPISTLAGLVNAAAFVDGSATATGATVVAEFTQLLNKTNEIVTGVTDVAGDLVTAEASIAAMSGHEARLDAIEGKSGTLEVTATPYTLTTALKDANSVILAAGTAGSAMSIYLRSDDANGHPTLGQPITIINTKATQVVYVLLYVGDGGEWGTGATSTKFTLAAGEAVTLAPYEVVISNVTHLRWAVVAGKKWTDLS